MPVVESLIEDLQLSIPWVTCEFRVEGSGFPSGSESSATSACHCMVVHLSCWVELKRTAVDNVGAFSRGAENVDPVTPQLRLDLM